MPKLKLFSMLVLGLSVFWGTPAAADQELNVFAGAGLMNALQAVAASFEASHPGSKIVYNFASSGVLLQQMASGAPADVFAVADQKTMNEAQDKKLIIPATRTNFASNRLLLIEPQDSKLALKSIADLAGPDVKRIAIGNPATVPVGRYTQEALTRANLWDKLSPKFVLAETVRQVLDYVKRGEVEAGFVYASDVAVAQGQVKVAQTVTGHAPIVFPMAVTAAAASKDLARDYLALVMSPAGQEIIQRFGFSKP